MTNGNMGQLNSNPGEHPQPSTRQPNILREWVFHMEKGMAENIGDTIIDTKEGGEVIILPVFGDPDQPHVINLIKIKVVEKGQGGYIKMNEIPEGCTWSRWKGPSPQPGAYEEGTH